MAEILKEEGTTFKDYLVLPDGYTEPQHAPDVVSIDANLAGVVLKRPFLPAAMRSVVGEDMALAAGKLGMMPVVPRALNVDLACGIVRRVKERAVKVGDIEFTDKPVTVQDDTPLGDVLEVVHRYGHSTIPVVNRLAEFRGVFFYKPIDHDRYDPRTPVSELMLPYQRGTTKPLIHCVVGMSDAEIREYLAGRGARSAVVLDEHDRLVKLVFAQKFDGYKVGAAVDTHPGWEARARELIAAGADMIFTDTSDGFASYEYDVIRRFKEMFPNGPPICGGNIVTPNGFRKLVEAGADVIKIGMGSGSICTTNLVLGVGAPPFWALKAVADERDRLANEKGRYVPVIIDGGIEDTWDINVALTHADAVMGGKIFAGFHESAGELLTRDGKKAKEYFGEGSQRAALTSGDMRRYDAPGRTGALYQGVDSTVPYQGHLKPGAEEYCKALRFALSHTACVDLAEYRQRARLLRLSEGAKKIAQVHGVAVVNG